MKSSKITEENKELIQRLYEAGFIVKKNEDEALYKKARELVMKLELRTLFLIITDKCNFQCKYCFEKLPKYHKQIAMDEKTARTAIRTFARETQNSKGQKTIFFYGGEPLLNFKVVKSIIEYASELIKKGELSGSTQVVIITNGSLIDQNFISLIKKQPVSVCVSLDGFKHNQDNMRVDSTGHGTYDRVIQGINLLKDNGVKYSLLCTVGPHNIDELDKICAFFIRRLGAKSINLIRPACKVDRTHPFSKEIPVNHFLNQIIKASKVVRKYGTFEGTFFRSLISFVEETVMGQECDGMGYQVVVSPDGRIGPCVAFMREKGFFTKSNLSCFKIKEKPIFKKFARMRPLMRAECKNCPALGICGGGCIHDRFVKSGKLKGQDDYFCEFTRGLLAHLISELGEKRSYKESI